MKNIKLIRLISGEEVLAEVLPLSDSTNLKLKNIIRVVIMPSKSNPAEPTVGLASWCQYTTDKEFEIQRSHVLVLMTPVPEFLAQYNQIFGNILTPANKLILPD